VKRTCESFSDCGDGSLIDGTMGDNGDLTTENAGRGVSSKSKIAKVTGHDFVIAEGKVSEYLHFGSFLSCFNVAFPFPFSVLTAARVFKGGVSFAVPYSYNLV
jgi:hypothetical protein